MEKTTDPGSSSRIQVSHDVQYFADVHSCEIMDASQVNSERCILSYTWRKFKSRINIPEAETPRLVQQFQELCKASAQYTEANFVHIDPCFTLNNDRHLESRLTMELDYSWYRSAAACLVYLSDVTYKNNENRIVGLIGRSKWFKSPWALQELLASKEIVFFDKNGQLIRKWTKSAMIDYISGWTNIERDILEDPDNIEKACIAKRLSWAANWAHQKGSVWDTVHSLKGILSITLPPIPREELTQAFIRLQLQLMLKYPNDLSIFAWTAQGKDEISRDTLLANSLAEFASCSKMEYRPDKYGSRLPPLSGKPLAMDLPLLDVGDDHYLLGLNCYDPSLSDKDLSITVRRVASNTRCSYSGSYERVDTTQFELTELTEGDFANEFCYFFLDGEVLHRAAHGGARQVQGQEEPLRRRRELVFKTEGHGLEGSGNFNLVPLHFKEVYATFSHTLWDHELTSERHNRSEEFTTALKSACELADKSDIPFMWSDIVCCHIEDISKLQQDINHMYSTYREAKLCYAYLSDTTSVKELESSEWFNMGWTLVHLLASRDMIFLNKDGQHIGTKRGLADKLSKITGIHQNILHEPDLLLHAPVAQRFSWAAGRRTIHEVNLAFCLLGLFQVQMAISHTDTFERAFLQLQLKIMEKHPGDLSIFAWQHYENKPCGLLAPSPTEFTMYGGVKRLSYDSMPRNPEFHEQWISKFGTVLRINARINAPILENPYVRPQLGSYMASRANAYVLVLNCVNPDEPKHIMAVHLQKVECEEDNRAYYTRSSGSVAIAMEEIDMLPLLESLTPEAPYLHIMEDGRALAGSPSNN
ncbi:hypothetical protein BDV26DRAFT_293451 [Aspergillus bertholletiae]|uniref:Heterokaryon incompatibility domain-containing protein n=1 Tax=Aspergillus bertholletiae TaxID=1226010 RepID=A0A5N7B6X8_9EURO|nr:hypothetical protein BDV26DRAFT_293451 [Aspergillus bertholletiae]